jgi:hypothetical protein
LKFISKSAKYFFVPNHSLPAATGQAFARFHHSLAFTANLLSFKPLCQLPLSELQRRLVSEHGVLMEHEKNGRVLIYNCCHIKHILLMLACCIQKGENILHWTALVKGMQMPGEVTKLIL